MKALPKPVLDSTQLARLLTAAVPSRLLLSGIELDLFSHLDAPLTANDVAKRLGTHVDNTGIFLDALAANGLVCKQGGRYENSELTAAFLVRGTPTYLGRVLEDSAEWILTDLSNLTERVRRGPPPAGQTTHSISWEQEVEIRANTQRSGTAQRCAAMVSQLPEFSDMQNMLDLGCGAGLIGLAIVATHSSMVGVLFDRPGVVEVAERFIREYEMEERLSTLAGDYTVDPIGGDYDLVWTSYTLPSEAMDAVIRKIYEALNPGGVYINLSEGTTHEGTQPRELINSMLANSLCGRHRMHEQGDVAQAMLRSGFRFVHSSNDTVGEFGTGMIDIARK
jgi:hypothetical protein